MEEEPASRSDDWRALKSLGEPTRRAVYDYVVSVGDWVGRDQAADATELERGTAVHHLERLAADGLLEVTFQRLTGRQGPGAGRPAKLYRRSQQEFDLSLPPRDYELAGRVLAAAFERALTDGGDIGGAIASAARDEGRRLGQSIRGRLRDAVGQRARSDAVMRGLEDLGYEPKANYDGSVVLTNCPFHQLSQRHTELVCGMNLCLLASAVEAAGADLDARLVPSAELCCVRLQPAS